MCVRLSLRLRGCVLLRIKLHPFAVSQTKCCSQRKWTKGELNFYLDVCFVWWDQSHVTIIWNTTDTGDIDGQNKVLTTRDSPRGWVTRVQSINLLALSMNVKLGPRFAEVCFKVETHLKYLLKGKDACQIVFIYDFCSELFLAYFMSRVYFIDYYT